MDPRLCGTSLRDLMIMHDEFYEEMHLHGQSSIRYARMVKKWYARQRRGSKQSLYSLLEQKPCKRHRHTRAEVIQTCHNGLPWACAILPHKIRSQCLVWRNIMCPCTTQGTSQHPCNATCKLYMCHSLRFIIFYSSTSLSALPLFLQFIRYAKASSTRKCCQLGLIATLEDIYIYIYTSKCMYGATSPVRTRQRSLNTTTASSILFAYGAVKPIASITGYCVFSLQMSM